MRFLVLADARVDLLVGAKSIVKHRLMAGPNFHISGGNNAVVVQQGGMFVTGPTSPFSPIPKLNRDTDKGLEDRKHTLSKCRTKLENLERELRKLHGQKPETEVDHRIDDEAVQKLKKKIEKAKKAFDKAEKEYAQSQIEKKRADVPMSEALRKDEVCSEFL
jgi:hypothetical protein